MYFLYVIMVLWCPISLLDRPYAGSTERITGGGVLYNVVYFSMYRPYAGSTERLTGGGGRTVRYCARDG